MTASILRQLANWKECLVRLPGCLGRGTTVLAHYRLAGICGGALKPSDFAASWACHYCHQLIDGQTHLEGWTREQVRLAHAEGVIRTLVEYERMGVIVIVPAEEF